MNFNDYKNPLTYPRKGDYTSRYYYKAGEVVAKIGPNEDLPAGIVFNASEMCIDEKAYKAAMKAYNDKDRELDAMFIADLLQDHGLPDNEFTRKLYSLAYSQGHSSGYSEIYNCFSELAELDTVARKVYGK